MANDSVPGELHAAVVDASAALGRSIPFHYFTEVTSTNDLALSLALAGEPEGTVVLADVQTAGRGRRGRSWYSPPGTGLYVSTFLRPRRSSEPLSLLTLAAGVAVADAVRASSGLPVELKWPNDLVVGRPWRKLGGVLCEAAGAGQTVDAVIVGIGVNVAQTTYPSDVAARATSLEAELGRSVDRAALLTALLLGLDRMRLMVHERQEDEIRRGWRRFGEAGLHGAPVRWQDHETTRRGRARDIDVDGALLVETDGRTERLVAGEVIWESCSRD